MSKLRLEIFLYSSALFSKLQVKKSDHLGKISDSFFINAQSLIPCLIFKRSLHLLTDVTKRKFGVLLSGDGYTNFKRFYFSFTHPLKNIYGAPLMFSVCC